MGTHTHQSGCALSQLLALLTAYTGYISELMALDPLISLSSHLTCSGGCSDYTAAEVSPPKQTPTKKDNVSCAQDEKRNVQKYADTCY